MKRTFVGMLVAMVMLVFAGPANAWDPPPLGTTYQLKSTDFGHYVEIEGVLVWNWNPNFYDPGTNSAKLYVDALGNLNMDDPQTGGSFVAEFCWTGTAVTPKVQPWAFECNDTVIFQNLFLAKRIYEDPSENHTRLSFTAFNAKLIPDCSWVYDDPCDGFGPRWFMLCNEERPTEPFNCYEYAICCGEGPNYEDVKCGTSELVDPGCECVNLGIFKVTEGAPQPIDISDIDSVRLCVGDSDPFMNSDIALPGDFYQSSDELFTVPYKWKPGRWEGTSWRTDKLIVLETDPFSFTPASGVKYTAKIVIDEVEHFRDIGPGNFNIEVPLVSSTIETPFVTPSGKETKKMLTGDNIAAFERYGSLVIQWGEPIVDPVFNGGRIELRPDVAWDGNVLWIEAPPQTGTVVLPAPVWNELNTLIPDGESASVRIVYRAISGESGGGTPDYSRCEVRTYSERVPVQLQ